MPKLTTERARERIQHLKQWQQQRGLTLREEEYLEALQTHLRVTEAEPIQLPQRWTVGDNADEYFNNVVIDYWETVEALEAQGFKVAK